MNISLSAVEYHSAGLTNITMNVRKGEKIALLGANGSGKSTIMKLIAQEYIPDKGTLNIEHCWAGFQYVSQEASFEVATPFHLLKQEADSDLMLKWLDKLGFAADTSWLHKNFSEFSGGQKKAIQIAYGFMQQPDVILLDEPENHLDIVSRLRLVSLMNEFRGILLFVSHDRTIINEVATSIGYIEDGELQLFSKMSVEEVLIEKEHQRDSKRRRWISEEKSLEQLKKAVVILRQKALMVSQAAGSYRSRKNELEKRKKVQEENRGVMTTKKVEFTTTDPQKKNGKLIFELKDVSCSYEKPILKKVNCEVRFGERIALLGRNGCGKTTLLNLLFGSNPQEGIVKIGPSITFGWFSQSNDLDVTKSALQLIKESGVDHNNAPAFAAKILLDYGEATGAVSFLSGGQLSRLRVALMLASKPDCIILDEPTNNLDSETWEELTQAFAEFKGTLIVVSHDISFLSRLELERFWVVNKAKLVEYKTLDEAVEAID